MDCYLTDIFKGRLEQDVPKGTYQKAGRLRWLGREKVLALQGSTQNPGETSCHSIIS